MERNKADNIDKNRLRVDELLPSYIRTEVIQNVFENTVNKFLTKEDSIYISGGLGETRNPKIPETNVFREKNQLQPLIYSKNGSQDTILSQEDILIWMRELGVDIAKMGEWASTVESNLALPINPDKIVNYVDYFWVSDVEGEEPDYIVMKDRLSIAKSRRQHIERLVQEFGLVEVEQLSPDGRILYIDNDFKGIVQLKLIEIFKNGESLGTFNVRKITSDSIHHRIEITTSMDFGDGDTFEIGLTPELNRISSEDGQLRMGQLWNSKNNHWKISNKWTHKDDLIGIDGAKLTRATRPIIEFEDFMELNEWISVSHKWMRFNDERGEWVETIIQPTKEEIWLDFEDRVINPEFTNKWIYLGIDETNEVGSVEENDNSVILRNFGLDGVGSVLTLQTDLRTVTIPNDYIQSTLAGTMTTSVYVDGILQEGTYREITNETAWSGIPYSMIVGIEFNKPLDISSDIEIILTPLAEGDEYRYKVPLKLESGDIILGDISRYVKLGQVKYEKNQFPKFNLYNLAGEFIRAGEILEYSMSDGSTIEYDNIQNFPVLRNNLIEEGGATFAYRDLRDGGFKSFWSGDRNITAEKLIHGADNEIESWDLLPHMKNIINESKNRIEINEIVPHYISLLDNQEHDIIGDEPSNGLLYDIDYNRGGTIKFHDNCLSIITSLILTDTNLEEVIKTSNDIYEQLLNEVRIFVLDYISEYGISSEAIPMSKMSSDIFNNVSQHISRNDYYRKLINDSNFSRNGFLWVDTLASFGWVEKMRPMLLIDDNISIRKLRHHDGHISSLTLGEGLIENIYDSIVNYNITPTRKRGWSKYSSPDNGEIIEDRGDIPVDRLLEGDVWMDYETNELFKLDLVHIGTDEPVKTYTLGSKWYNTNNNTIYELGNSGNIRFREWRTTNETLDEQWIPLNVENIILTTILEIEEKLYELSPEVNNEIVQFMNSIKGDKSFNQHLQKRYTQYKLDMGITESDDRSYDPRNPFSWNYGSVMVGHPSVFFPYHKNSTLWSARYEKIYENIFGTSTPHLTPWEMQNFTNKPEWWDDEYLGSDGRWKARMWDDIKAGQSPAVVSVGNLPTYDFIPVNITNETTYDGYAPGDLLPPYWEFKGDGTKNNADIYAESSVLIRDEIVIKEMNILKEDPNKYDFGEYGPIEYQWRQSSRFLYDELIAVISISPIKAINLLWGADNIRVNGMTCDSNNSQIVTKNLPLHGQEGPFSISYLSGLGQWVSNFNRFRDMNGNTFHNIWYGWEERYGYLMDGFADPKSLELFHNGEEISKSDYNLFIKTTKNKNELSVSGLRVRVKKYGAHVLRNNKRIPRGYGHDWIFEIDSHNEISGSMLLPKISNVIDVDIANSELILEDNRFENGDRVDLATNDVLPTPLRSDRHYYVIKTERGIKLALERSKANMGEWIELGEYTGIGFIEVSKNSRKFFAMGGSNTAIEWKFSDITDEVENFTYPLEVRGVQNLIDVVRGISEYSSKIKGIKPNPDGEALDPEFGKLTSWSTEIEKMIDAIFRGVADGASDENERVSDIVAYEVMFDPISDTFDVFNKGVKLSTGSEVFIYTTSVIPDGLSKGEAYYIIETSTPSKFRLATSLTKAMSGDYIDFQTNGSGRQYITMSKIHPNAFDEWIYVNPFYNNFWIPTNYGSLGGINFSKDIDMVDGGNTDSGDVFVYRYDKGSKLAMRGGRHFSHGRFKIDASEHALLFNRRSIDGQILYDGMIGQGLVGLDRISYKRVDSGVGRASFGGYVINKNVISPNFEKLTIDLNTAYNQFGRETDFSHFGRELMGYPDNFMDGMGISKSTKFQFWKNMIHKKGTKETIDALKGMDDLEGVEIDELWAYRKSIYGSASRGNLMEFTISPEYLNGSDLWISSRTISTRVTPHNTELSEDPLVPPVIDCDYLLDGDDFTQYTEIVNEMGFGNSKLLASGGGNNSYEFNLREENVSFIRASQNLIEQFNDSALSFRGDSNISRPNMVGFQLNVQNPFTRETFTTAGERVVITVILIGKDSSGRGNTSKVELTILGNGGLDIESKYQDVNGNWGDGFKYDSPTTDYEDEYKLGFYIRKNTKSIGVIVNGHDYTIFDLNDFPNTSEYFFENLGVIIGTEFVLDGTTTSAIKNLTGKIDFISNTKDFQDGFPIGSISNICSTMLVGASCFYPTENLTNDELIKASEILFHNENVRNLGTAPSDNTGMGKIFVIEDTNDDVVNYINLTNYIRGKLATTPTITALTGDLVLEQPNIYSLGIKIDNFLGNNNLSQTGSSARVGFIYRGIDISLTEQWELELRMTAGQEVLRTGFSNTIEVEGWLIRRQPSEGGGGNISERVNKISRIIALDGIQDLTQLEFGIYIDSVRSTIGIVANAEDYGLVEDISGNILFLNGKHNTMVQNGYVIPFAESSIVSGDDRIGDEIKYSLMTRLDVIGDEYGGTLAICDKEPITQDVYGGMRDISFNWGTVNISGDSVIRIGDRWGNYASSTYGEKR